MNERRLELGLTWRQVAAAAQVSYEALRAIRRGGYRPAELTARRLDEAFQWESGSTIAALDGGDPVPRRGGAGGVGADSPTERAIAAILAPLTPREREAVLRRVAERLAQGEAPADRRTG